MDDRRSSERATIEAIAKRTSAVVQATCYTFPAGNRSCAGTSVIIQRCNPSRGAVLRRDSATGLPVATAHL